jgi:hypothetical protein
MAAPISVRLKVNPLESDTFEGLGLDVVNTVHGGRVGTLADENDAPFHVDRREARVIVDNQDDRQVDCRKNVDVHQGEGQRT